MSTSEYLFCTRCGSEEFAPKPDAVLEQEFKGESLEVVSPAMACTKCRSLALADDQLEELRRRTADAYRRKHNLLTSAQIKAMRASLGKTQQEFAALLHVGEASVKRWETWLVQEKSSDALIRLTYERALRDKLPRKSTRNVWISVGGSATEAGHGITIQTELVKIVTPSRWDVPLELPEPGEELEFSFCWVTNQDFSGLSPPDAYADAAFSSSMLSPERLQTEGIEEENAARLKHPERTWLTANYGNIAPTFAPAA